MTTAAALAQKKCPICRMLFLFLLCFFFFDPPRFLKEKLEEYSGGSFTLLFGSTFFVSIHYTDSSSTVLYTESSTPNIFYGGE